MADGPNASESLACLFAGAFPLRSHLCREPMSPMPELKREMENLTRHGFSLVKLQEHSGAFLSRSVRALPFGEGHSCPDLTPRGRPALRWPFRRRF